MFKSPKIPAPQPPPPPPNPPTYAGARGSAGPISAPPSIYAGLGSSIMTSPMGAPDEGATRRKSLLGQ